MAFQILLNLLIALVVMFLQSSFTAASFLIGYLLGMFLLFGLRRFFPTPFYIRKVVAIINLLILFLKELILANIEVLKVVLKPKLTNQPGIFALPTELTKDWEITTLANLITLTPGTLVIDVSDDNKILYIHAMDIDTTEKAIQAIKSTFEKAIMEVSR